MTWTNTGGTQSAEDSTRQAKLDAACNQSINRSILFSHIDNDVGLRHSQEEFNVGKLKCYTYNTLSPFIN